MLKPEAYRHKRILEYLNAREVEDRLQQQYMQLTLSRSD